MKYIRYIASVLTGLVIIFFTYQLQNKLSDTVYIPKPYGYPKIDVPQHVYQQWVMPGPYTFMYSKYTEIQTHENKHWFTLHYPLWKADLQMTYKSIKGSHKLLSDYCQDSQKLVQKIQQGKLEIRSFRTKRGYCAIVYHLEDNKDPSPLQFYVHDIHNHFIRGALYFNCEPHNDYLRPIITFIEQDIEKMIETLKFY